MFKFIKRAFRYGGTKANMVFDAKADPKVLIQQAMDGEQKRHGQLVEAAASVLGSKRQSQMNLDRLIKEKDKSEASIEQALLLAVKEPENAEQYHQAADRIGAQVLALEDRIRDTTTLLGQQEQQAQQAKDMVDDSLAHMQESQTERARLLNQVEGARMQKIVSDRMAEAAQLTASDTPTLANVRSRVEGDMAKALGTAELAESAGADVSAKLRRAALSSGASTKVAEIQARLQSEGKLPALEGAKREAQ